MASYERASAPEDLSRFFVDRFNTGDVDGIVALYEPDAVLANPLGQLTSGRQAIRRFYEQQRRQAPVHRRDPTWAA